MKKVPFELFGAGEYMYMDIGRFIALESMTGKPIGEIIKARELDLGFIVKFLVVAMRHHGTRQPQFYIDKLQERIEDMTIDLESDVQEPIVKCVVASGILGKAAYYSVFPNELTAAAAKEVDEEKN